MHASARKSLLLLIENAANKAQLDQAREEAAREPGPSEPAAFTSPGKLQWRRTAHLEGTSNVCSGRSVAALRPSRPLILDASSSVADAAAIMGTLKVDAGIVVTAEGRLRGILTDSDLTSKVVASGLDPNEVVVEKVMTLSPYCVNEKDSGLEAICMMLEGGFRHLPVVDSRLSVVGVLSITKCLTDAISGMNGEKLPGGSTELQGTPSRISIHLHAIP